MSFQLFSSLFPAGVLAILTVKIILGFRRAKKERSLFRLHVDMMVGHMTSMLLGIMLLQLFFMTLMSVTRLIKTITQIDCYNHPSVYRYIIITDCLVPINYSFNFIVYILFGRPLRQLFMARLQTLIGHHEAARRTTRRTSSCSGISTYTLEMN